MVEFVQRRSPVVRARRPDKRRIVHHELPWAELGPGDDELWQLVDSYRRERPAWVELNRGLVLVIAFSLLTWLLIAFAAVELIAAR